MLILSILASHKGYYMSMPDCAALGRWMSLVEVVEECKEKSSWRGAEGGTLFFRYFFEKKNQEKNTKKSKKISKKLISKKNEKKFTKKLYENKALF